MGKEIGTEPYNDVAVIGGGAVGLAYAIRVKRDNPELRVLVLEKANEPRFKIGESTLSVTIEHLLELGFTMPQLRRLFTVKSGLGFWYTDSATDELVSPVGVCDTEETFQVERRPMEIALTILAESCGVEIRSGAVVSTGRSVLDGPDKTLVVRGSSEEANQVHCRLVCDATGPASVMARSLGTHRKQKHINTNAYWSHFRKAASPGIPGWDAPMTHHICFPQGWFWFINLCSWESSPTPNLTAMIRALLKDRREEEDLPNRQEWSSRFGCTHSLRVSIGVSPRSDLDYSPPGGARERFWHYGDAYPAIQEVMRYYEEVPDPYQGKPAYGYLKEIEHYSTSHAGEGFLAVGDAAFFVNPLFSKGLAFGMFCAKEAATATAGHLKDPARGDFARYDRLLHSVYRALSTENEALYRSWASPAGFEQVLVAKLAGALREVRNRAEGLVHEDVPYRLLAPRHAKVFTDVVALTRDPGAGRQDRWPEIAAVTGRYLEELRTEPETIEARLGRFLTHYDDNLVRHENAAEVAQPGVFAAVACPGCRQAVNATLRRCPGGRPRAARGNPSPPGTDQRPGAAPDLFRGGGAEHQPVHDRALGAGGTRRDPGGRHRREARWRVRRRPNRQYPRPQRRRDGHADEHPWPDRARHPRCRAPAAHPEQAAELPDGHHGAGHHRDERAAADGHRRRRPSGGAGNNSAPRHGRPLSLLNTAARAARPSPRAVSGRPAGLLYMDEPRA